MKLKRKWTMGIIATVSVLILAACGGESTPTSPIAPRADLVSPTVAAQTPTAIPTVVAEIPVGSTVTSLPPAQETAPVSSDDSSRFIWEISTVDDNGAKPSLAVNRDGVPHIAFMLEAMPASLSTLCWATPDGISLLSRKATSTARWISSSTGPVIPVSRGTTTTKRTRPRHNWLTESGWSKTWITPTTTDGTTTWYWI